MFHHIVEPFIDGSPAHAIIPMRLRTSPLSPKADRLAGAYGASLSNTITLEMKALTVRMYFKPQAVARAQKSSLM